MMAILPEKIQGSFRMLHGLINGSDPFPQPGLHHFRRELAGGYSRVHLRVNLDGSGCLIVDAAQMVHLNPTATLIAYHTLKGAPDGEVTRHLCSVYAVKRQEAEQAVAGTRLQLDELIRPDGACPVHELQLDTVMPFTQALTAPYRMDLALTYRCNNDCSHCYNARARTFPEMDTAGWKKVLGRMWDLAIPHVVFTGGEPTLRDDLPALIGHAESLGMITGINTNGRKLAKPGYIEQLVDAGLDHIQITLESHLPEIHDRMVGCRGAWKQTVAGVQAALGTRLYVMTNTTLLTDNSQYLEGTLAFLSQLGVKTIGLNSLIRSGKGKTTQNGLAETDLEKLLPLAMDFTLSHGQKLIWYTPTRYCHFDPVMHHLGIKGCSAARYNMCVEPDGAVLPCQSYYQSLGNILTDPWDAIWNHPLSRNIRDRAQLPGICQDCAIAAECGGGCPLEFETEIAVPTGEGRLVRA